MRLSVILKNLIPIFFTLLSLEIGSRFIAHQPITTTWRKVHKNGLLSNRSNIRAIHEHWNNRRIIYSFGNYANRIPNREWDQSKKYKSSSDSECKYLILGDSVTFGWLVNYQDTFPALIENRLNKENHKKIYFLNAAAGGWGFADYASYLEVYKNELQKLNLKGILVFVNIDDANRAAVSNLYILNNSKNLIFAERSNQFYKSKIGLIRRSLLNNKFITPFYNFLQRYSNLARLFKNYFLNGAIAIDPSKSNSYKNNPFYSSTKSNKNITTQQKIKVEQSLIDLSSLSSEIGPLNLVHTGLLPLNRLTPVNRYFFSEYGKEFLSSKNINFDFSTITEKKLYGIEGEVKYDGHPNSFGHKKIADNILTSSSKNSLENFINRTCP